MRAVFYRKKPEIEANEFCVEKDGVWHCLLVTGEGMEEGVLVESEGASYARCSAFVPSVKEIMEQYQTMQKTQTAEMNMGM